MEKLRLGFGMTGSFCTWAKVVQIMAKLAETYDIVPILSPISYVSENRFGKASEWIAQIEKICRKKVWHTIEEVGYSSLVQ